MVGCQEHEFVKHEQDSFVNSVSNKNGLVKNAEVYLMKLTYTT